MPFFIFYSGDTFDFVQVADCYVTVDISFEKRHIADFFPPEWMVKPSAYKFFFYWICPKLVKNNGMRIVPAYFAYGKEVRQ